MYLAELHGKLSSKLEKKEDILTSNVFSFFKYSNRDIFLKEYLHTLGFNISTQEAKYAEFKFWPRFEDNTEPDLVLIVGNYYLLIEAKYFSEFAEETKKSKAQLLREIENGKIEAKTLNKDFNLIAITADYYYKENKFKVIPSSFAPHFKWTNWQTIALLLNTILESNIDIKEQERDFALDLYNLLDRKNLRDFRGLNNLFKRDNVLKEYSSIFFEARTTRYRGQFIGFKDSLLFDAKILPLRKSIFLSCPSQFTGFKHSLSFDTQILPLGKNIFLSRKRYAPLFSLKQLKHFDKPIFYKE